MAMSIEDFSDCTTRLPPLQQRRRLFWICIRAARSQQYRSRPYRGFRWVIILKRYWRNVCCVLYCKSTDISQSPLCWSGDKIDWRHRQKWSLCWQAVLVLFQGVVEKRDKIFYGVVLVSDLEWVWMGVWFLQFSRLAWPLFDLGLDIAAAALPRFRNPPTSKLGTWVIYNISRIPWPKSQMLFQNQNHESNWPCYISSRQMS